MWTSWRMPCISFELVEASHIGVLLLFSTLAKSIVPCSVSKVYG